MKKIIALCSIFILMSCSKPETNSTTYSAIDSSSSVSSTISIEPSTIEPYMPKQKVKVYLNPSVQTWNKYVNELGDEAEHMNNIAHYMVEELSDCQYIDLKANLSYLPLSESVKEINSFNADIHLALHSNAGGGQGSEILTIDSKNFASTIYDGFLTLGNFKRRGIKDGSNLYEIKHSHATHKALIELLFHDNSEEALFIVNNEQEIAKNICDSLKLFIQNNY